ncbi:MAG: site-specific tyrosine recombinase XerD [Candidatus Nanopelagicales bacterium]
MVGYLDHISVERGLSAHTVQAYGRDLRRYQGWCADRQLDAIDAIRPNDVSDFAVSLRHADEHGPALSASSAARAVIAVRALHKFAVREGWTVTDPCVDVRPTAIPQRLPKALAYSEISSILEAAGDLETPSGLRDRALLELLYGTGTRISEAIGLDVDDLDFEQRTLVVTGKGDKQRRLPLGEYAAASLSDYLVRGRPPLAMKGRGTTRVFLNTRGGPLSRQSAWQVLSRAAQRAGIDAAVSPHTMRHSFATHLLEGGADVRVVQELLGHSSVTTTQIYTQVTAETLRQVYATSHPRAL